VELHDLAAAPGAVGDPVDLPLEDLQIRGLQCVAAAGDDDIGAVG
jgi:hypothetical protein